MALRLDFLVSSKITGAKMMTFNKNIQGFIEALGDRLSVLRENTKNAVDGLNTTIRSDIRDTLNKYYWAKNYDEWTEGEILGQNIGYYNTVYCKASNTTVAFNANVDFSKETTVNTGKSWEFTNHLSKGRYLINVRLLTWWGGMSRGATCGVRASIYDAEENLITQAYVFNQGDSGHSNNCRTPGVGEGIGIYEVSEDGDYEFTVNTKMTSYYNYFGVLIGFSRQF